MKRNFYQILGLKEDATQEEIKKAYRLYASKLHPDKNNGDLFFEELFKEIKEAYDTLSNVEKRRKYDLSNAEPIRTNSNSAKDQNRQNENPSSYTHGQSNETSHQSYEKGLSDIDGNVYRTIKIGSQIWMAENLQVTRFQNGDSILFANSNEEWESASRKGLPAWCWSEAHLKGKVNNDKLYNWYAIIDKRNIAPYGFMIPSIKDWNELQKLPEMKKHFGGAKILKSKHGWENKNLFFSGNGDNKTGFNAYPSGLRDEYGRYTFLGEHQLGKKGFWWCSTMCIFYPPDERMGFCCGQNTFVDFIVEEHNKYLKGVSQFCRFSYKTAYSFSLDFDSGFLCSGPKEKGCGFSVRCIRND